MFVGAKRSRRLFSAFFSSPAKKQDVTSFLGCPFLSKVFDGLPIPSAPKPVSDARGAQKKSTAT